MANSTGGLYRRAKIDGFVEAVRAEPTEAIHPVQIAQGFRRVDGEPEERRVGRDHEQI